MSNAVLVVGGATIAATMERWIVELDKQNVDFVPCGGQPVTKGEFILGLERRRFIPLVHDAVIETIESPGGPRYDAPGRSRHKKGKR